MHASVLLLKPVVWQVKSEKYHKKTNISDQKRSITGEGEHWLFRTLNSYFLLKFHNLSPQVCNLKIGRGCRKCQLLIVIGNQSSWDGTGIQGNQHVFSGPGSDKDREASGFRMLQWAISTLLRWPFTVARHSFLFLEWVSTLCNAEPHCHPFYMS